MEYNNWSVLSCVCLQSQPDNLSLKTPLVGRTHFLNRIRRTKKDFTKNCSRAQHLPPLPFRFVVRTTQSYSLFGTSFLLIQNTAPHLDSFIEIIISIHISWKFRNYLKFPASLSVTCFLLHVLFGWLLFLHWPKKYRETWFYPWMKEYLQASLIIT